jgi:hypothetical protein
MSEHHEPIQNHLLNALSPAGRERLYPQLEPVAMPLGKVCTSLVMSCATCIFRPPAPPACIPY